MRFLLVASVLAAAVPARADDAEPPPQKTPFDRGRFGLALGGGTQTAFGSTYFVIGGGLEYFVLDGVGIGVSALHEFGSGPSISKVSPALRYVAQPLVGKWPVVPYVGGFYNHWFIGDSFPDVDTIGARAGLLFVSGQLVLGLGVAIEHTVSTCTMDCNLVYPDFAISLAL
jgi:hypothetical protein